MWKLIKSQVSNDFKISILYGNILKISVLGHGECSEKPILALLFLRRRSVGSSNNGVL